MRTILRRIALALIGASILAVAAGVLVIALALALYGLLQPRLGGPGAAACLALGAAVLLAVVGFSMDRCLFKAKPKGGDQDLLQKLIAMAQERPLIAVGALIGAIFLAIRNPALVAVLAKAFLDPGGSPGKKG